ncbi:MAG: peptide chain release factor N(5)-glutamine methyltransferase [Candidatus Schekmanbacteria bacterium]|nr:peptide chain release factor N(5)-glutamine methyltransferase [Candidatus Schekmanbacteria bacterium]
MEKIWTIIELLRWTTDYFAQKHITMARLDAELLLAHTLGIERTRLYLDFDRPVGKEELFRFRQLIQRRAMREPVAYILGCKEFWSLRFKVISQTLIPRPETEILVETAVNLWREKSCENPPLILDIGAGSGIIAVSLAKEIKNAQIIATDISPKALEVARENAQSNGVADQISWHCADLFNGLESYRGRIDLLVSNPPYIRDDELPGLQPEVRDYEPHSALLGGKDGLDIIRRIINDAGNWLKSGGCLCLEIGAGQGAAVCELLEATRIFSPIRIVKDYARLNRVVWGQRI